MADRSAIEWTDSTFNPWIGCTKVSDACTYCYAEVSTAARTRGVHWGHGMPRHRTSAANWKLPLRWNARPFFECETCRLRTDTPMRAQCISRDDQLRTTHAWKPARRRVFCASLADWLDNEVPAEWLADLLSLISSTPNLDWLLLTKRMGNWRARLEAAVECFEHRLGAGRGNNAGYAMARNWLLSEAPANVWIGATICNQTEADRDIPKLLAVPAAVRFLSIEPMLAPVDLFRLNTTEDGTHCYHNALDNTLNHPAWEGPELLCGRGIDWVIAGGESGPHARPMHPDWVRSLRDQCAAVGVPFMFKQWGEWIPTDAVDQPVYHGEHQHLGGPWHAYKVGKKAAGRMLDGVAHDGYPEAPSALA